MTLESLTTLENPAPALEIFHLFPLSCEAQRQLTLRLFSDQAPRLRNFSISNIALKNWASPILSGLQSLSLTEVTRSGPSLNQLLCALKLCPELRKLDLGYVHIRDDPSPTVSTVILPALTTLHLHGIDSRIASVYFTTLSRTTARQSRCSSSQQIVIATKFTTLLLLGSPQYSKGAYRPAVTLDSI